MVAHGVHHRIGRVAVLETGGGVPRFEHTRAIAGSLPHLGVSIELAADNPVVLRHEGQPLALALADERQRGGLHAPRRAHIAIAGELHQREVAGEHRAPNEVDVLAGGTGGSQVVVHGHQVVESPLDLLFGEGGIAGAAHRRRGVHLATAGQGIGADQLALAVEVGGNHDGVRLLRQILQRADDVLLLGQLLDGGVHQIRQRLHLPPFQHLTPSAVKGFFF